MAEPFRVIALVAAYNEADIIGQVIGDLIAQGVDVYLLDHGSTDATIAEAERHLGRGLVGVERFPEESGFPAADGARFAWRSLLRRKEQLARTLDASWFLHQDADELREAPWDGVSLGEAIRRVDALGYSAIDFRVLDFVPTSDGYGGEDLRAYFTHYRPPAWYNRLQINCWKRTDAPVDLASSGGHDARFAGRRVFPVRFLLRHYPIRSQAHGERKVFRERRPRFDAEERAAGWHVQYDEIRDGAVFIAAAGELVPFDAARVRTELLVENRELEEVERRCAALEAELAPLRGDVAWYRVEWPGRERELVALSATLDELGGALGRAHEALVGRDATLASATGQLEDRAAALRTAEEGQRRAEAARGEAEAARGEAEVARGEAEAARAAAHGARGDAEAALADLARELAATAQALTHSQRAQAAAEGARGGAEAALTEAAQELATVKQTLAQSQRAQATAEGARADAARALTSARADADAVLHSLDGERRGRGVEAQARAEAESTAHRWHRDLRAAQRALEEAQGYARDLERRLQAIDTSASWRLSAPLRDLARRLRGR
jgi:glycosyltransferase involved in cell wall biosynthesis